MSRVNTKLEVPYPSCLALGQSTFNIIFIFQAASNTTRKRNPFETTLNNVKFQIKLNRVPHFNLFCSWCYISVIVGRKLLMIIHQLINQIAQTTQVRIYSQLYSMIPFFKDYTQWYFLLILMKMLLWDLGFSLTQHCTKNEILFFSVRNSGGLKKILP